MGTPYKRPRVGALTKWMQIFAVSTNPLSDGGTDEKEIPYTFTACSIESPSGETRWLMKAQQSTVTHFITMRYQPGIVPQMRGLWNGRRFNFTSVIDPEERHVMLEIEATEIVEPYP
jgi:head-tail adaptor